MSANLEQLVKEVIDLTGADRPVLYEDDAPVLSEEAMRGAEEQGFYLVGLIGGKEVGKSAMVNALVGKQITQSTSFGEGTQIVTAYAHVTQEAALRELLDREVPGRYAIVTHEIPRLYRQILLDLPDIDSHWAEHVEVTRRMLRQMLFPIWMQSVEKYADIQPQQAERLARLQQDAEDRINERLGIPLLERCVPAMLDDPSHRMAVLDDCLKQRTARWPFVGIVQGLAAPLTAMFRRRLALDQQRSLEGPESLVELDLRPDGRELAQGLQTAFGQ